jgi:hypothetical protein
MGATPDLCICCYCGKIVKRTDEDTPYIKCLTCQKKGNNKLLPLDKWNKRKMLWLRKLQGNRQKKRKSIEKK